MSATLAPDSLICESTDTISFVSQNKYISGAKADYVIGSAGRSVQMADIQKSSAYVLGQRAERQRLADLERDRPELEQYQAIVKTCASSGAVATNVEVVESKPISGIAKIKLIYKGQSIVVFVNASSLSN